MSRYGPDRKELWFRLWFSVAGLALLVAGLVLRSTAVGPAFAETIALAGLFFGGTLIWTIRKLVKGRHSDGL